jgi:hypothetical protein
LLSNQAYQWQIRARCGKNWTDNSAAIDFKTLLSTPPAANTASTKVSGNTLPAKEALQVRGELQVLASPNPSASYFTLVVQSGSDETIRITVADVTGRIIDGKAGLPANGTHRVGQSLRPGVYFAEVMQGSKVVRLKLVKQMQ